MTKHKMVTLRSDSYRLRSGSDQLCSALQEGDARMLSNGIKPGPKKIFLLFSFLLFTGSLIAQLPDVVYKSNIRSVRFHMYGNQLSLPVYNINSGDQLELNFDDMDGGVKSYYYSFQLCDYDWKPVDINTFNYLKGFTQQRISIYRYSSIALTKYTHYQAMLPDRGTTITLSGNYMLKVFLDGDTSKLAFTQRLLVLDQKASINGRVLQPFSPEDALIKQKISFTANINGLNSFSAAQQVKVVILQNNRWDNAQMGIAPTFVRGNSLEYSNENNSMFPAGKEWRWLDLRSFKLQSDRVDSADYNKSSTEMYIKTDIDRGGQRYAFFRDLNGMYSSETYETINPYWQADYATVHFSLFPANGTPFSDRYVYIAGQLTNYELNEKTKMIFNPDRGVYEIALFLKQGYYNYTYIAVDKKDPSIRTDLEGNYWETENGYTILMYYRSFTDRSDQLIGVGMINSRSDKPGVSF